MLSRSTQAGPELTVTDLGSQNGSRVDGTVIEPHTPTPLHNGSNVAFGALQVVFLVAGLPREASNQGRIGAELSFERAESSYQSHRGSTGSTEPLIAAV